MASNNFTPGNYNYEPNNINQNQYTSYQHPPAANALGRQQYQPNTATMSNQQNYMTYPSDSYGSSGNYGSGQDGAWAGSNYGSNRETTNRAAEVLRNMSNTAYQTSATSTVSQPGFTATNAAAANAARYSNASPAQQQPPHAVPQQLAYGQSQSRPRSVNANSSQATKGRGLPSPATAAGYPVQRAQKVYDQQQQQQRSKSPALKQYQYKPQASSTTSTTRHLETSIPSNHQDYSHRQLPSVESSRTIHTGAPAVSYSFSEPQHLTSTAPPSAPTNVSDQFSQTAVNTVDPMAVYDPWPEYRRKEALRLQKEAEDAARAEEQRKAEESRLAEERRRAEDDRRRAEEERKRADEERKRAEEDTRSRQAAATIPEISTTAETPTGDPAAGLEAEIRAMMAKMREFNNKDPSLLAKIWEEERRAKAPKSPTVQNKTAPRATATPSTKTAAAVPPTANQRKKAAPKESATSTTTTTIPAARQISNNASPAASQPLAPSQVSPPVPTPSRPTGNTIWPPEKRAQLANAAATYLNAQNPANNITVDRILAMLDGNPSYIELCEQLESMSLRLDRAAFAKNLLTAVPDVNSASRSHAQIRPPQPPIPAAPLNGGLAQRTQPRPPPAMQRHIAASPAAGSPHMPASATPSPLVKSPDSPFPDNGSSTLTAIPVAEMVPIKPELKPPANKEEAARKRTFNDLIDLTLIDDEDAEPAPKRTNMGGMFNYASPSPAFDDSMIVDVERSAPIANIFPTPANIIPPPPQITAPSPTNLPPNDMKNRVLAQSLDKKKALRRSAYNPATIARDVLLACGRHPDARQLNGHLEIVRMHMHTQVPQDADLTTLRWDILDPGEPPKGYYQDRSRNVAEDADDEDESEDEEDARLRAPSQSLGGDAARVQALPDPTNPFKVKRRGRPPRKSYPDASADAPASPVRNVNTPNQNGPSPRPASAGVGYSAFRSVTMLGPDGQPLPKKKGRPVGWRKAIHGSAAAQTRSPGTVQTGTPHAHTPTMPSNLGNVRREEPIVIKSRSPSVLNSGLQCQAFRCKWHNCTAELHNLETLKKHVHKVHRKHNAHGNLDCLWKGCGRQVSSFDSGSNVQSTRNMPFSFTEEPDWREHLEIRHFGRLSWEMGDGPASGISDAQESDAYLSDANGRQVTPRIVADTSRYGLETVPEQHMPKPRGRGRPPKVSSQEQEARATIDRLIAQKKRVGGPGIDRGGATFVNDKRRRGFSDDDQAEEQFVDVEP